MKRLFLPRIFLTLPIAHRGLHDFHIAENSYNAISLAVNRHYNVEIDVRMSHDGVFYISHHDNLYRIAGVDRRISEMNSDEIDKLRLWDGQKIMRLDEVFTLVNGQVGLVLELKNKRFKIRDFASKILNIINQYGYPNHILIMSFNPKLVRYLKKHTDRFPIGQMSQAYSRRHNFVMRYLMRSLYIMYYSHGDFISYCISNLPNRYCSYWRKRGYPVIAWIVRNDRSLNKALMFSDNFLFETIDINNDFQKELLTNTIEKYQELTNI